MPKRPEDFLIDHVSKMMRQTTLPREIALSVDEGSAAYAGRAVAMKIAGIECIVMARTLPELDIVFNKLHPSETLRTSACPEIVIMAKATVTLDEEL